MPQPASMAPESRATPREGRADGPDDRVDDRHGPGGGTQSHPAAVAGTLRQRVVTALLLAPLVMLAVLLLPTAGFALVIAAFAIVGAWEWAALAGVVGRAWRVGYAAALAVLLAAIWFALPRSWDLALFAVAAAWWLGLGVTMARIRRITPVTTIQPKLLALGLMVLAAPWLAMTHLHAVPDTGPALVLSLLLLIWIADSAAYFAGRRFGRRKLAVVLSPGKTWAGVWGALAGAGLWGALVALPLGLPLLAALALVLVCALAAVVSIIGDLYESLLKRRRGLKDAGNLLPGHGGMLDRIDSIVAAAPVFALGLLWLLSTR